MPKRYCKGVNILDLLLVKTAVLDCLHKGRKRRRRDTVAYFGRIAGVSAQDAERMLTKRTPAFFATVDKIVAGLIAEMQERKLKLPNTYHHQGKDKSSGKVRRISILHIKNLLLDHMTVSLAMRLLSYKGWLIFADCSRFLRRHNANFVFAVAAKRISLFFSTTSTKQLKHDRQKQIYRKARRGPLFS